MRRLNRPKLVIINERIKRGELIKILLAITELEMYERPTDKG